MELVPEQVMELGEWWDSGSHWPALTGLLPLPLLCARVPILLWSSCWKEHAAGHHHLGGCHLETGGKDMGRGKTQENILNISSRKTRHQYCEVRGVIFPSSLKTSYLLDKAQISQKCFYSYILDIISSAHLKNNLIINIFPLCGIQTLITDNVLSWAVKLLVQPIR